MPRYFFDLHNDIQTHDEQGQELPDLAAAREVAVENAREMICANIREHGHVHLDHYINVRDETGDVVLTLTFRETFTIFG